MAYYEIAVRKIAEDGDVDPNWQPVAVMLSGSAHPRTWEQAAKQLVHAALGRLCA